MANDNNLLNLKVNQQNQILDQYRMNIYNLELRFKLINKMLEEKGLFSVGEFDQRWPLYLKNDVDVVGQDGIMEGTLKIKFYNGGNN